MRNNFHGQSLRERRQKYKEILKRESRGSRGQMEQRRREKSEGRKRKPELCSFLF